MAAGTKTQTRTMGPTRGPTRLVDVDRWYRWLSGRRGIGTWKRWAAIRPDLEGWSPAELLWPLGSERTDRMQASLVALSQAGEGEAAHLLLVQLRPGLTRLTRWAVGTGRWRWDEATDEVRAAFFETLYRHRLERRPRKIAANLILDTKQRLHRGGGLAVGDHGEAEPVAAGQTDPTSTLAVTATILAAVNRLPGTASSRELTAAMAYRAWVLDQPRSAIAADLGLQSGAVTARLHRLRALVDRRDLLC